MKKSFFLIMQSQSRMIWDTCKFHLHSKHCPNHFFLGLIDLIVCICRNIAFQVIHRTIHPLGIVFKSFVCDIYRAFAITKVAKLIIIIIRNKIPSLVNIYFLPNKDVGSKKARSLAKNLNMLTVLQKLGMILGSEVFQKLKLSKKKIHQKNVLLN